MLPQQAGILGIEPRMPCLRTLIDVWIHCVKLNLAASRNLRPRRLRGQPLLQQIISVFPAMAASPFVDCSFSSAILLRAGSQAPAPVSTEQPVPHRQRTRLPSRAAQPKSSTLPASTSRSCFQAFSPKQNGRQAHSARRPFCIVFVYGFMRLRFWFYCRPFLRRASCFSCGHCSASATPQSSALSSLQSFSGNVPAVTRRNRRRSRSRWAAPRR